MPMEIKVTHPSYKEDSFYFSYETFVFNGGEVFFKLTNTDAIRLTPEHVVIIETNIESSHDLMLLLNATDSLRRLFCITPTPIMLFLNYFPYARQDRVMEKGQALSVKVMADIINAQKYDRVVVWDAHSDVTPALLNNCYNRTLDKFNWTYMVSENTILVSPDAGANKKVLALGKELKVPVVRADKVRDIRTGEITGTEVYSGHVGARNFLIVDDICDGGKTFIELAKVLRPKTGGRIDLCVTHGIFSKGLNVFEGLIDTVYCRNPFSTVKKHAILDTSKILR